MENKDLIVRLLEKTINATGMGKVKLTYIQVDNGEEDNGEEYVQIDIIYNDYQGYSDRVCVTRDNGFELIRDVMSHDFFD